VRHLRQGAPSSAAQRRSLRRHRAARLAELGGRCRFPADGDRGRDLQTHRRGCPARRPRMSDLEAEIRDLAARRRLPQASLARWLQLDEPGRAALLKLAHALRLRTGQLVATLDLLDEISVREQSGAAEILARPPLRRVATGSGSAPERARELLDQLRAIRFPRLRETTKRLEAAVA